MAEARRRLATASPPLWIVAERQIAGIGRRGRVWRDPEGNYAGTLLLDVPNGPTAMALRSFVAALAVHDAVSDLAGSDGLSLKWPNDVLLHGGKLSGILLEALDRTTVAIGIGVNLKAAPERGALEDSALAPATLSGEATVREFHDALRPAFDGWEDVLRRRGFDPVREAWLARAAGLGNAIRARLPAEELHGTFEGIDGFGHLILRTARGVRHLPAADIAL